MKQEIAKLLLDIVKYIVTGVILTSMWGELSTPWMFVVALMIIVACVAAAYFLLRDKR